ncbi:IclR family transcriptional regulator [Mycolicibacterium arabiense]|nr:IclR family transcriptional regulator [Mycolicibacterium arabiense]
MQSLHRALDILETVARRGGRVTVAEVAESTALPMPTVHRVLRTLVERGYMRQMANRSYVLGYRLMPLASVANATVGAGASPVLADLVTELGETANLAVLAGEEAEYIAQAPSRYAMRMFTEVGRRVELHSTGVGKALLAQLDDVAIDAIVGRGGLPARTEHTLTTRLALLAEVDLIRRRGFALDEQEQEIGVRCVAVPLESNVVTGMAVSVSGPVTRMTDELVDRAVPLLQSAARQLVTDMVGLVSE